MERLTTHDEGHQPYVISANEWIWRKIYERLTEYEDTGLTSEEITSIKEAWDAFGGEIGIQHAHMELEKYRQAEAAMKKEG